MKKEQIEEAITNAQKGIGQYLDIMEEFHSVDVSSSREFQKKYNAFYRVQRRTAEWYETYYGFMEQSKNTPVTFAETLDYLNTHLGRYEPSFSSKLAATVNPFVPIWDEHILNNTGISSPAYQSASKVEDAKDAYVLIEQWYIEFLKSDVGRLCVNTFNEKIFRYYEMTDLKKVDFILWQTRA